MIAGGDRLILNDGPTRSKLTPGAAFAGCSARAVAVAVPSQPAKKSAGVMQCPSSAAMSAC
jgi:hypothetical protein